MGESESFLLEPGAGLKAKTLLDTSPQHHGVVMKLHRSTFFSILPRFLQRIIEAFAFLSFLAPSWKQRHLILCGSYLYKFQKDYSKIPKGSPFEVEHVSAEICSPKALRELGVQLPPTYTVVFTLATLRRTHYYAVADKEEALVWIRSLQEAKQERITRQMGHSSIPYPKSWAHFDCLAKGLVQSKNRIRERMESNQLREMEMTQFSDASPIHGGIYS